MVKYKAPEISDLVSSDHQQQQNESNMQKRGCLPIGDIIT